MSSKFQPHSHFPYGKEGSGHYTRNIQAVGLAADEATGIVLNALEKITDMKKKKLYTICDYGTADGGNSMNVIRTCIAQLKSLDPDVEVQVWYEDQPTNDYMSLFNRLYGYLPDAPTYLHEFQGVYPAVIGTQFFEQCVPSNSVDLAFSSVAVQWLSKRPCDLTGTLVHILCEDEEEAGAFKDQAAKDWEAFLMHRASELVPGGRMVIVLVGVDHLGNYAGNTDRSKTSTFKLMTDVWKNMEEEGIITKGEFINTTFNFYFRTLEELEAPFKDECSAVLKSGLQLISLESKTLPCTAYREFKSNGKGDKRQAQIYAAKYVNAFRVFSNHTMFSGLSDVRPEPERRKIVDEFYRRIENIVVQNPENHVFDVVCNYVHIAN